MRVQRVVTNETCNQNCWFCNARRPVEDARFVARAAVRRRISDALDTDTREIVLTGGEPTLRSDLPDLVRQAAGGSARVVLETNAARLDERRARDLAAAGLATARIQLTAWGDAADAISREPGAFAAAVRGLRALAGAGVAIEVTTPIVRRNLDLVAAMPRQIVAGELPVATLVLVVPATAPDASERASLAAIARAITAVTEEARRVGLPLRLDPTTYVPPCVFEKPERVAHLFALNRGNAIRPSYARVPECADCLVEDRCPGMPHGFLRHGDLPRVRPVVEPRLGRRLTVASTVEEQVARELVSRDDFRGGDVPAPEVTVRVNFRCNQACEFCFVSTHLPSAPEAAVRTAIETAARERAVVVLSGGEPTLNPRLVEYVRLANDLGAASVELQTNATRLAHADLAATLAEAGLGGAMISLHGSTAAISDAVTGAPGTFAATVRGIDALVRTPVRVRLNFVFCQENREDFPRMVDLVAERWPAAGIVFSFVGSHTDVVPRSTALIPRFRDVMPSLVAGLARARAAGLAVSGFESMCGLPRCVVPEAERAAFSHVGLPAGAGEGEFVKAEACGGCAETHRCFGVRRGYAELYGTGELQPIAAGERSRRAPAVA
ncbi:MAG: radical SAM protein [Deltaproteobacteria bacterium]|nr:radical SAM protein [Deltaproteobacteria bacterium]